MGMATSDEPLLPVVAEVHGDGYDEKAGVELGYVLVAGSLLMFVPFISEIASITTFVVACVLVCGCCCAKDYNMAPRTRGYAKGVLAAFCISFVFSMIFVGIVISQVSNMAGGGEMTAEEAQQYFANIWKDFGAFGIGATIVMVLMIIASLGVVTFSCLFTFKR